MDSTVKNIAFVGNGEPPAKLLEIFKKMTPGRSGVWGQLKGVDNYKDADYYMVIDWLPRDAGIDESKCIFLNAHPETVRPYRNMSSYKCFAKIDATEGIGFLEYWLKYDYDYLKALQPMAKTEVLGCIMSNASNDNSHKLRRAWLDRFCTHMYFSSNPRYAFQKFNLFGRIEPESLSIKNYYQGALGSSNPHGSAATGGNDHMSGKEETYREHKYMLEFDNIGSNYFSERVLDCMLMWSMPLYWGGQPHKYLPENSFRYIDINGRGDDVIYIVNSNFYEEHLEDLAKARQILLDELQLWPKCHNIIFGRYK